MATMWLMENLKKQIQSILDNYRSGNLTQAELLGKKLITENPNVVFLYNLLGLIYVGQKKIDLAHWYYSFMIKKYWIEN